MIKKHYNNIKFWIFKVFYNKFKIQKNNKFTISDSLIKKNNIEIFGSNNKCNIDIGSKIENLYIKIKGKNNSLFIKKNCKILSGKINIIGDDLHFLIGNNTTIREFDSVLVGKKKSISIGNDCMLGSNIKIWNGEMHPIYSLTSKKRLNNSKSIEIGDHVWIGSDVVILKGSNISEGSVVGVRSLVKGKVEKNVVVAGSPARKIRDNIKWKRR